VGGGKRCDAIRSAGAVKGVRGQALTPGGERDVTISLHGGRGATALEEERTRRKGGRKGGETNPKFALFLTEGGEGKTSL